MQRGSDRTGPEQTADADEDLEMTRALHDLAVANDAGEDPDPDAHDLPQIAPDPE